MHWRLGRKDNPPEETGHPEVSAGVWTLGRNTAVDHFVVLAACFDLGGRTSEAPDREGRCVGREVWAMETH